MAFKKHKFTINGVEHQLNTPAGSELSAAVERLIEQHAIAMNTPQWRRFENMNDDGTQRWTMRMVGGKIELYDIKLVEE